jgi:signal transduction histidine kinase
MTRPRVWSRGVCVSIIVSVALMIGIIDYLSGPYVSLRPFYYLPIALAQSWFGWRAATMTSFACVVVWMTAHYFAGSPGLVGASGLWNGIVTLATFLFVVWALHVLLTLHREMEERIESRTASLQAALAEQEHLQRELIEVGARERNAVGRELHDGLCQHLSATAMATQVLADRLAAQGVPVAENARHIVGMMQDGITQSRQLASGLLLAAIAPERLAGELRELAGTVSQQSTVACRFETNGQPHAPDAASAAQLFRIAQEGVRNAVKHAQATRITIRFSGDEHEVRLEVADNGIGLPPFEQRENGMGFEIMAHRARSIGGVFAAENLAAGGTRVVCRLPLASATA